MTIREYSLVQLCVCFALQIKYVIFNNSFFDKCEQKAYDFHQLHAT